MEDKRGGGKISVPEHVLQIDVQEKASAARHALLILMQQTIPKLQNNISASYERNVTFFYAEVQHRFGDHYPPKRSMT